MIFKKAKQYAITFYPKNWMILSVKYGFLSPNEIIQENYNTCFAIRSSKTISIEELQMQIETKNLNKYNNLIVLG
jgi:hypothetical protein